MYYDIRRGVPKGRFQGTESSPDGPAQFHCCLPFRKTLIFTIRERLLDYNILFVR